MICRLIMYVTDDKQMEYEEERKGKTKKKSEDPDNKLEETIISS